MKYSKPLYGILGVYIPLSVLILWAPLPGIVYGLFNPAASLPAFGWKLWCLAGFLSALGASAYAGVMKKSMLRHSAADLRGAIAIMAAAYIIFSLFTRSSSPAAVFLQRFLPSVNSIAASLGVFYIWFSVISVRQVFNGLELFESFTAQYRGEQLRENMREFSPEMSQTDGALKRLMVSYALQFIPPCLFIIAAGYSRVSPALIALAVFLFSVGFLLLGFLGLLRRELACASEGISVTLRDRSVPLPVMALGTGAAALLALAGSSDTSLLPPGIILGILAWLGKILSLLFRPRSPMDLGSLGGMNRSMQQNPLEHLFPQAEAAGPWPGWKWIKYGVIVLAILVFLYFMIHPLLKRHSLKFRKIRTALTRWLRDLGKGLSAFFSAIRGGHGFGRRNKNYKGDTEKLRRIASELLSGSVRRKNLKPRVNLFARLILWGIETLSVPWKPSIPPGEYCALLAAAITASPEAGSQAVPGGTEKAAAVIRCGELFEKALYAPIQLSDEEEREFKNLVERITG